MQSFPYLYLDNLFTSATFLTRDLVATPYMYYDVNGRTPETTALLVADISDPHKPRRTCRLFLPQAARELRLARPARIHLRPQIHRLRTPDRPSFAVRARYICFAETKVQARHPCACRGSKREPVREHE